MTRDEMLAKATEFDMLADRAAAEGWTARERSIRNQAGIWRINAETARQAPTVLANGAAWAEHVKAGGD